MGGFIRGGEWMNSAQAIDLKKVFGGNCDQNTLQCLFDSAGSAGYIELGLTKTMYAEITAAVQSLRTLGELAKTANSLANQHQIVMAVADVNAKLMDAMTMALASQERHSALLARVAELEQEIVELRAKQLQADKYALHKFPTGAFAYRLKEEYEASEPGHYLCAKCHDTGTHSKFQPWGSHKLKCTTCQTVLAIEPEPPTPPPEGVRRVRSSW